jgi:hypothetical protein
MSADANAIPLKKSRSDLLRTGRPIAIDIAPPQFEALLSRTHVPPEGAQYQHDSQSGEDYRCITYRRLRIKTTPRAPS